MAKLTREQLIQELASFGPSEVQAIVNRAYDLRYNEEAEKEHQQMEANLKKIPKRTLNALAKKIKTVLNPVDFALDIQLDIKLLGRALWDPSTEEVYWDLSDHEISTKMPKGFEKTTTRNIEYAMASALEDCVYDLEAELRDDRDDFFTETPTKKSFIPEIDGFNKTVDEIIEELRSLEADHELPEDAVWNYLVEEGKI
jgi:hypothetical protein